MVPPTVGGSSHFNYSKQDRSQSLRVNLESSELTAEINNHPCLLQSLTNVCPLSPTLVTLICVRLTAYKTIGHVKRHLELSLLEGRCYRHLVGKGQRRC